MSALSITICITQCITGDCMKAKIETEIRKIGNSLGILLPKEIISALQIKKGVKVNIIIEYTPQLICKQCGTELDPTSMVYTTDGFLCEKCAGL